MHRDVGSSESHSVRLWVKSNWKVIQPSGSGTVYQAPASVLELRPVRNSHLFQETAVSLDPAGEASSAILDELSLAESPHEADEARALGFADATDS